MKSTERERLIARISWCLPMCSTQELLQIATQVEVHTATVDPAAMVQRDAPPVRDTLPSGPPAHDWQSTPRNLHITAPEQGDER